MEGKFTILSVHRNSYQAEHTTTTKGLLNAIERHHDKIDIIGHPYDTKELGEYINIKEVVELANHYHIPLEFNNGTFAKNNDIRENVIYMLENAEQIYVNSDAHSLSSMRKLRKECFDFLEEIGIK
ncbi:MAG: hypothetical protein LBH96_01055 [Candidatus Peribacteria bacterium]|jgi:histidinol phosphatase-like PHP family hydrolase|nr:hypothetical protein [Candidatus Peribacteria bacterium]